MKRTIPLRGALEYDALTRWKRFLSFAPGERKKIKRAFNKRERKYLKKVGQ
jgi:hypothetical protein